MNKEDKYDSSAVWGRIWSSDKACEDFEYWFIRDMASVRTQRILDYLNKYFDNLKGLKAIELGSGMGVYSLIMAKRGSYVTLCDKNPLALSKAEARFKKDGIAANFIEKDIFSLNSNLLGTFDIAMSFGLVEHFLGNNRFNAVKMHFDLVKDGGVVIVSVPNKIFLPHEMLKKYLIFRKKWQLGYEVSFSKFELYNIAKRLKLKDVQIVGSSFTADIKRYIKLYRDTNMLNNVFGKIKKELKLKEERPGIFDNVLGADIVLLGRK